FLRGRIEKQLQSAGGVTANLAARDLAKIGHAHFVGNSFVRELLFRFANEGDFGNAVNPVRVIRAVGMDGHAEGAGGGDAALFHGNRAEAGKTRGRRHWFSEPRLGKPMTSPTAKMCSCLVRYCSSTEIRPRASASSPAAARFRSSMLPWRPTA